MDEMQVEIWKLRKAVMAVLVNKPPSIMMQEEILKAGEPVVRLEQHQTALAAKEQELARMKATLQNHWVTAVECNHEDKTDTVRCSCSVWTGTPQPSIGKAIEQWVQHVMEQR